MLLIDTRLNKYNISDKVILQISGTLNCVADWYKNQEMFNKAVDNYRHTLEPDSKESC